MFFMVCFCFCARISGIIKVFNLTTFHKLLYKPSKSSKRPVVGDIGVKTFTEQQKPDVITIIQFLGHQSKRIKLEIKVKLHLCSD